MSDVSQILAHMAEGDERASAELFPLIYDELRRLAAARLRAEKPGITLQATALVHEAYLRLVDPDSPQTWNHRGHFFAAASEAMRRILVEAARRRNALKRGGDRQRVPLSGIAAVLGESLTGTEDLLALDAALTALEAHDGQASGLVKLRYFSGLTMEEASAAMEISERQAYRLWNYAKAWLHRAIQETRELPESGSPSDSHVAI